MSSIMRRRSGLMGVVVLIGVLLVLRWRLLDPSTLKTGHFPSRSRALVLTPPPGNMPTDVPRLPQLARSAFVVCPACSIVWGCKSPVQPDGGEGRVKHKGVIARWRLKEVRSKAAT